MPDVKINGVGYRLAEDAEGEHYSLSAEPLRPPNAVTVQGEDTQKFQMRPDTLLWSLSDWSGGEGQNKFDPENGNRWKALDVVEVFDPPGHLKMGWGVTVLEDDVGELVDDGALVYHKFNTFLLSRHTNKAYLYQGSPTGWDDGTGSLPGPTNGASRTVTSDGEWIFFHEYSTDNVWRWNGSVLAPSLTQIDSGGMLNFNDAEVAELGDYVYVYSPTFGQVWEISKTGTSETLVDEFTSGSNLTGETAIATAGARVYIITNNLSHATIREITPTSAAGPGFGAEIARLNGVLPYAMWAHQGLLYVLARSGTISQIAVFYIAPGGEYGTLGQVRTGPVAFGSASAQNSDMLQHFFLISTDGDFKVYQVDAISGNMACIAKLTHGQPVAGGLFDRSLGVFWNTDTGSGNRRSFLADYSTFGKSGFATSPWNDFALADEKILSSLVLSMEELPADWRVRVDYAINGDEDTWVTAIDETTTNSTGGKTFVSTDSSTVKFRTLALRIRMDYTGAAETPTTTPTILGVDALAMVAKPTKVWRLLLDLSDSKSRAGSVSGSQQATNLADAANSESVVSFTDYYGSYTPGVASEHDVIVDSYALVLSHPGEGVAAVTLKEIS